MAVAESIEATKQPLGWTCMNCFQHLAEAADVLAHPNQCQKNPHYLRGREAALREVAEALRDHRETVRLWPGYVGKALLAINSFEGLMELTFPGEWPSSPDPSAVQGGA